MDGYFGSFCATHFGVMVPEISVRSVPLLASGPIRFGSFCASVIGSIRATLKDQVTITLSLKNKLYGQYT